jgi:hypothetical protein
VALLIGLGLAVGLIFFARFTGKSETTVSTRDNNKEV